MSIESRIHRYYNDAIQSALDKEDWKKRGNSLNHFLSGIKENQICNRLCGASRSSKVAKVAIYVGLAGAAAAVFWFAWKKLMPACKDLTENPAPEGLKQGE